MDASVATCDVLILGASFAGLECLYQLRRTREGRSLSVVIVDRQAVHGYIPLVQERLVGRLDPAASELATSQCISKDPRTQYVVGEIAEFLPESNTVTLTSGMRLRGEYVVIALGSVLAAPPAVPGGEQLLGYKFVDEYAHAKARMLAMGPGTEVVVVGGGISGVELAGELAHHRRDWSVTLVDAGPSLLRGLTPRAGRLAARRLQAHGVQLQLNTRLVAVEPGSMRVTSASGSEVTLRCDLGFWAAGVRPAPVLAAMGLPRTPAGYLAVTPTLQCTTGLAAGPVKIFGCGDAVRVLGGEGEWPTMQRAIECLWQAKLVARNILALVRSTPKHRQPPQPHVLRRDFPHGVSIGAASLIVYGWLAVDLRGLGVWFRRFLMRQYFARYGALRR